MCSYLIFVTGIGLDDTFVMLAAWRRTSIKHSVPERMGKMLSEAAVSITITSVTDMISFWIGILSPFPSVQIFCTYSGKHCEFFYSILKFIVQFDCLYSYNNISFLQVFGSRPLFLQSTEFYCNILTTYFQPSFADIRTILAVCCVGYP